MGTQSRVQQTDCGLLKIFFASGTHVLFIIVFSVSCTMRLTVRCNKVSACACLTKLWLLSILGGQLSWQGRGRRVPEISSRSVRLVQGLGFRV